MKRGVEQWQGGHVDVKRWQGRGKVKRGDMLVQNNGRGGERREETSDGKGGHVCVK